MQDLVIIFNKHLIVASGFLYLVLAGLIFTFSKSSSEKLKKKHQRFVRLALVSGIYCFLLVQKFYIEGDGRWANWSINTIWFVGFWIGYAYLEVLREYAQFPPKVLGWMKKTYYFILSYQGLAMIDSLFGWSFFPSILMEGTTSSPVLNVVLDGHTYRLTDPRMLLIVLTGILFSTLIFQLVKNYRKGIWRDPYIVIGLCLSIVSGFNDAFMCFGWKTFGFWFYVSNIVEILRFAYISQQESVNELVSTQQILEEKNKSLKREIQNRMEIQNQLVSAKASAVEANRAKSNFLALVNHEIKTPLSCLQGSFGRLSQILESPDVKASFQKANRSEGFNLDRYIEIADKNLLLLKAIINNLLDASSLKNMSLNLSPSPTNMLTFLENLRDSFFEKANKKNINLDVRFRGQFNSLFSLDEVRLYQILYNLVMNAIRYTPEGGKIRITCEGDLESERLMFKVIDNGPGIPKHQLKKVFLEFARAEESAKSQVEGLGLGLYVANKLAKAMGGKVKVKSRLKLGSVFSVQIKAPVVRSYSLKSTAPLIKDKIKVLLVEDHIDLGNMLKETINEMGCFDCELMSHSKRAMEYISMGTFDFVISDLMMPDFTGIDLLIQLRKQKGPLVPFILLSGRPLRTAEKSIVDIDPLTSFSEKPISQALLRTKIMDLLKKKEQFLIRSTPPIGNLPQHGLQQELNPSP